MYKVVRRYRQYKWQIIHLYRCKQMYLSDQITFLTRFTCCQPWTKITMPCYGCVYCIIIWYIVYIGIYVQILFLLLLFFLNIHITYTIQTYRGGGIHYSIPALFLSISRCFWSLCFIQNSILYFRNTVILAPDFETFYTSLVFCFFLSLLNFSLPVK